MAAHLSDLRLQDLRIGDLLHDGRGTARVVGFRDGAAILETGEMVNDVDLAGYVRRERSAS